MVMYDKSRYIIRQQANTIRKLEQQLHDLRQLHNQLNPDLPVCLYPVPLYDHFVSVWYKDDRIKLKITITPCFLRLGNYDAYDWLLVDKYIQKSFVKLERMIIYES
jgi:hypothetical protein